MLQHIPQRIRRHLRGLKRADHYPILLPHFQTVPGGLRSPDGMFHPVPEALLNAATLCDGTRTLQTVAREARVPAADLIRLRDEGKLILWPHAPRGHREPNELMSYILSPHPDDAALSIHGQFDHAASRHITIVNVFTHAAWWRLSEHPDPDLVSRTREAEERLVARLTGTQLTMLGLPEALLRGYLMRDVFGAPAPDRDADVRRAIAAHLSELALANPEAYWILPLAVGNHVDHLILRDEALRILTDLRVTPARIQFYEDLPYAADLPGIPDFSHQIPGHRLHPNPAFPAWPHKAECLRVYWSQLTDSQITAVMNYAARIARSRTLRDFRERTWTLVASKLAPAQNPTPKPRTPNTEP